MTGRTRGRQSDADASGTRIQIEGRVLDGDGMLINDAMLRSGRRTRSVMRTRATAGRAEHEIMGFGRSATDVRRFQLLTPSSRDRCQPNGKAQAPHIVSLYFSRACWQVYTRLYFVDEPANDSDPILSLVPGPARHARCPQRDAGRSVALSI
jgi:protocatechuate 3,4-dioxygenase alpha subunit